MSSTWMGARPKAAAAVALLVGIAAAACGDDTGTGATAGAGGTGGEGAGQGGQPTGGSGGGTAGGGGEGGGTQNVCTQTDLAGDVATGGIPYDATPSPDGCDVYFTGYDPATDVAAVYQVKANGGPVTTLAEGLPLASPFGIATNADGTKLFIADPAADEGGDDGGLIFVLDAAGGDPAPLDGTAGYHPRSLEVAIEGTSENVYFTGRAPTGEIGVFKVATTGGSVSPVAVSGLSDPSGIAIASNLDLFVVDTVGSGNGLAAIKQIASGGSTASTLTPNLHVGYPAGIAISEDDGKLYVSGLDPATLTDVVLFVDAASGEVIDSYLGDDDTSFGDFQEAAGLHRAKNTSVFSFVDSKTGPEGTVFVIQQ